jgi:hypothetical protein
LAYQPKPIDTSRVRLTPEMLQLTEALARNAHEIWAQQRLAGGWVRGARRDDARKEHPGLVPYERLPESEKDVDRDVAMQTVKALIALGYSIMKKKAPRKSNRLPRN